MPKCVKPIFLNMRLIDIHTHKNIKTNKDIVCVRNLFSSELNTYNPDSFFSAGIHPWHVKDMDELHQVEAVISNKNVVAVGETGLDKLKPEWDKQTELFHSHIELAKKYNKPLIIHCVRAYSEIQSIIESKKFNLPVVFHWFSGSPELARQLTAKGYFLSFGQSLFDENSKTIRAFAATDLKFIFLETDASDFSISEIYQRAANLRNIDIEQIAASVQQNFHTISGLWL